MTNQTSTTSIRAAGRRSLSPALASSASLAGPAGAPWLVGAMGLLRSEGGVLGPDVYLHSGYELGFWGLTTVGLVHVVKARDLRLDPGLVRGSPPL